LEIKDGRRLLNAALEEGGATGLRAVSCTGLAMTYAQGARLSERWRVERR
jgi:hypothetical protein